MGFITIEGENQIAAKQGAKQTLNITSFVLANIDGLDPNNEPPTRVETLPVASDIMDTLLVTKSGYVNTNQVVYSLVMDSSIGDYDFNWVGLVDDENKLIAVTYTPLIQKRATSGAVPGNNLTRNFLIASSGIQATTAIAVPAETWQIDFNARLWGIDERERLSNFDIYGEAAFIEAGWQVVRDGATTTYNVLPGIGYVGGIRIVSGVAQQMTVADGPNSIWVDVSLQGDISDVSPVVDFIVSNVAQANYTDPNGFKHYLTKLCSIAVGGAVTDERTINPLSNLIFEDDMPLRGMVVFDAAGSFTWNVPEGVNKAHVTVVGGGGAGGFNSNRGGGGGGGGAAISLVDLSGVASVSVTVGQGGVANSGGSSSFGSFCSATGGVLGGSTLNTAGGGLGGVGVGQVVLNGSSGADGGSTNPASSGGGNGGVSLLGGAGRGGSGGGSDDVIKGKNGSGGGGGTTGGGKGGDGVVIVRW